MPAPEVKQKEAVGWSAGQERTRTRKRRLGIEACQELRETKLARPLGARPSSELDAKTRETTTEKETLLGRGAQESKRKKEPS